MLLLLLLLLLFAPEVVTEPLGAASAVAMAAVEGRRAGIVEEEPEPEVERPKTGDAESPGVEQEVAAEAAKEGEVPKILSTVRAKTPSTMAGMRVL
mmetsp:Transcript_25731/g.38264  ORF Transcript_25731/g.38264 Transcript_25731/m.38264 type:complete len:96 (-) Transcript_25731:154-441(-)